VGTARLSTGHSRPQKLWLWMTKWPCGMCRRAVISENLTAVAMCPAGGCEIRPSVILGHFPAVPTAHLESTSAAWSQPSPIWQAAAVKLMPFFGVNTSGIQDLGTLPGDDASAAVAINACASAAGMQPLGSLPGGLGSDAVGSTISARSLAIPI
jgi:hypothetical protein